MGKRQDDQAPSGGESWEKGNLYEEVTARVVAELERGSVPWVQPWGAGKAALGLPRNGLSGQRYSGINILILWGAVIEGGYPSQFWLTYRQALALDGHVRKGERGVTVFYADRFTPKDEIERAEAERDEPNSIPFLKRFTVFNASQCEGLVPSLTAPAAPLPERMVHEDAERTIAATNADFRVGGDRAYYVPSADYIQVPPQPAFFEQINYYRTCFHELGHWTGHEKRLARNLTGGYGSKVYAREELVAEMTSAFLCAALGIVPTVRHSDYLGSWLEVLREDSRAIFRAASRASKAADFIRAFARIEDGDAS
jgi:antirestriction protein ArdC